jgi:hypothetical protein
MQSPQEPGIDASDGSAFPLILEHCMLNPASYEIPLRSMYTLNCQTRPLAPNSAFKESAFASPAMQNSPEPVADAASQFKAQLISHIAKSPQQLSLPVGFMVNFVRRVFAANLEIVDFPQALTALDYLKNLERRRHKDVVAAFKSLAIDVSNDSSPFLRCSPHQKQQLQQKYPGVVRWIESIEDKERKAHHYYKNVCVSLRRWVCLIFILSHSISFMADKIVDLDQRDLAGAIQQGQLSGYAKHPVSSSHPAHCNFQCAKRGIES